MGTDLTRIGEKARKDPELVFTSLYHHITDIDNLRASYDKLLAHKASGIDGVTKEEYGKTSGGKPSGPIVASEAHGLSSIAEASDVRTEARQREGTSFRNQQF